MLTGAFTGARHGVWCAWPGLPNNWCSDVSAPPSSGAAGCRAVECLPLDADTLMQRPIALSIA
eukprot:13336477-Alexandrium_andersonii.AAC.1